MIFYFPKFYAFFTKKIIGGLFDYYDIEPKEEKQKIRKFVVSSGYYFLT